MDHKPKELVLEVQEKEQEFLVAQEGQQGPASEDPGEQEGQVLVTLETNLGQVSVLLRGGQGQALVLLG